jgi:uncharacterized protein YjbI with pentapeptide repeats
MVKISAEELKTILEAHGDWLASEGKKGNKACLYEANLQKADLKRADLRWADLEEVDLSRANMRSANLQEADLRKADLNGANLCGADLTNTIGLAKKQVESATIDERTRLPDYL